MFRKGDESDSDSDAERKPRIVERDVGSTESQETSQVASEDNSGSDEEGGLFGNMMDLPDPNAPADATESSETSHLKIRDLAVPKHLPSAFVLPKKLLSEMLYANTKTKAASAGTTKDPVLRAIPPKLSIVKLDYTDISKGSRAKRVKLEVEWSPEIGAGKGPKPSGSKNSRSGSSTPKKPAGGRAEPMEGMSALSLNNAIPGSDKTVPPPPAPVKPSYKYSLEMTTTACATLVEAENYISLVLLHELTTSTPHSHMLETKSAGLGIELPKPPIPPAPVEAVKEKVEPTRRHRGTLRKRWKNRLSLNLFPRLKQLCLYGSQNTLLSITSTCHCRTEMSGTSWKRSGRVGRILRIARFGGSWMG